MIEPQMEANLTNPNFNRNHLERTLFIATKKLNSFFRLNLQEPKLQFGKINHGNRAVSSIPGRDISDTVELDPLIYEKTSGHATEIGIHELGHIFSQNYFSHPRRIHLFFEEGIADFLSVDDPSGIFKDLNINKPTDSYARIQQEIKDDPELGKQLIEFMSLDKIFTTRQKYKEIGDRLKEKQINNSSILPYWIGSSLTRYIVEKGGLKSLKNIVDKVKVHQKIKDSTGGLSDEIIKAEEIRTRSLLFNAIQDEFGDVIVFEQEWRETTLGKQTH